jgi:hypothetical protein
MDNDAAPWSDFDADGFSGRSVALSLSLPKAKLDD